jgi:hypothetical protein
LSPAGGLPDPGAGDADLHDYHETPVIALCTVLRSGPGATHMAAFALAKQPFLHSFPKRSRISSLRRNERANDDRLGNARATLREVDAIHSSDVFPLTNPHSNATGVCATSSVPNRARAAPHTLRLTPTSCQFYSLNIEKSYFTIQNDGTRA